MGASRSELQKFDNQIKNTKSIPEKKLRISLNNEGLCCVINKRGKSDGKKVFVTRYRMPGSSAQREHAHRPYYPAMTVSEALVAHEETMKLVRQGIDPKILAKQIATQHQQATDAEALRLTFDQVAQSYFETASLELRESTLRDYKGRYDKWISDEFGARKIEDLNSQDCMRLIAKTREKAGKDCHNKGDGTRTASIVKSVLSGIFKYAISTAVIKHEAYPILFTSKDAKVQQKHTQDHRVLSTTELGLTWNMLDLYKAEGKISEVKAACCKIIILTGLRNQEAIGMLWSELEIVPGGGAVYNIPKSRMKKNRPHQVYLTAYALGIISAHKTDSNDVFPSPRFPERQASYGTAGTAIRAIFGERQPSEMPRLSMASFSPHDLRRSFATGLRGQFGVAKSLIHEMIAHDKAEDDFDSVLDKIYIKDDSLAEKQEAWQKWSDLIENMVIHHSKENFTITATEAA